MVHLHLIAYFKCQVLQWDVAAVIIKEPIGLLVQTGLTSCKMSDMIMQTSEPASTREDTAIMVKIVDIPYEKVDLEEESAVST